MIPKTARSSARDDEGVETPHRHSRRNEVLPRLTLVPIHTIVISSEVEKSPSANDNDRFSAEDLSTQRIIGVVPIDPHSGTHLRSR